jgi:hypothetical protein
MTKDQLNAARAFDAAEFYLDRHFRIVPVPRQGKHKDPHRKGWQARTYTRKDFVPNPPEPEFNIGLRLGEEVSKDAYIVDVDIDMKQADKVKAFPGAAEVVGALLPSTTWVFGRPSAPRSHLLYLSSAPITSRKYEGLHDGVLLELRGVSPKKQSPQHTVVPPGLHMSGEEITFDTLDDPTPTTALANVLTESVQYAAVALAILQVWPDRGKRHDARLAFSKFLLEARIPELWCSQILTAVNRVTGSDVNDVALCLADTQSKNPADTRGASWIATHLTDGAATMKIIHRILGHGTSLAPDQFDVSELDLKTLTPKVWERIAAQNDPAVTFLQGGQPVRVTHIPTGEVQRRPTFVFQSLDVDRLRHSIIQAAAFYQKRKDSYKQVPPPRDLVSDMLATEPRAIPLPVVSRIVYAPLMSPNGDIQTVKGYQSATKTYYVESGLPLRPVSDRPTNDDIARAVATLREPIADFPFVSDADHTAAIALLLLPFVRNVIDGPTPIHLFKKPIAGAGATLLTDTLLCPSVGRDIARMSTVTDDDEWRKQITSTLLDGPSVVLIDNARELVSPQLAKVLTDTVWQARILGVSRNAVVPVECAWVATGINPDLHSELLRRVVPCRLDPKVARPWLLRDSRIPNLRTWNDDHRAEMIWAALTIARAWHVAGRPKGPRSLGMFESWADVIGGIVTFAGFPDFLANLSEVYNEADVEGDAIEWFYDRWHQQHGHHPVRITDVAVWALTSGSPMLDLMSSEKGRNEQFSKWVRRLIGRVVEIAEMSLRIERVKKDGKARSHTFRLAAVNGPMLPVGDHDMNSDPEPDPDPAPF